MELTLIEKSSGRWHIHTADEDLHLGLLSYNGDHKWLLEIADVESNRGAHSIQLNAATLDEARELAFERVNSSRLARKIADAKEKAAASNAKVEEVDPPTQVYISLFSNTLYLYYMQATNQEVMAHYMDVLVNSLAKAAVEQSKKTDELLETLITTLRTRVKEYQDLNAATDRIRDMIGEVVGGIAERMVAEHADGDAPEKKSNEPLKH